MSTYQREDMWSDQEIEAAQGMIDAGISCSKIADKISTTFGTKRTKNAVIGLCSRMRRRGVRMASRAKAPRNVHRQHSPPAPKPPKPPEEKRVELSEEAKKTIFSGVGVPLESCTCCRWPFDGQPTTYCNSPIYRKSYCKQHYETAYRDR